MSTTTAEEGLAVPAMVEAAMQRVRAEQRRAGLLLTGPPKYRRLSALHEQEARLWGLLVLHTAEPVHRRAATDAQVTARARAREYAEFAHHWATTTTPAAALGKDDTR
jgi:hypothetical protein